jgi:hypothetical protein
MIVTTIALPEDLHRRLAVAAIEDRTVMTELVRKSVTGWLATRDRRRAKPRSKP